MSEIVLSIYSPIYVDQTDEFDKLAKRRSSRHTLITTDENQGKVESHVQMKRQAGKVALGWNYRMSIVSDQCKFNNNHELNNESGLRCVSKLIETVKFCYFVGLFVNWEEGAVIVIE